VKECTVTRRIHNGTHTCTGKVQATDSCLIFFLSLGERPHFYESVGLPVDLRAYFILVY